ncbi:hypothetical protein KSP40_PGU012556 [Platanthera guangdongensis]|uniref:Translation elongation factor EFTu/EF1A C-terminal domain-containing protein n=1 Tax=Platanthera guangdongensis TaxID=2320717 RepID=A0ABR2LL26_9ASPA
MVLTKFGTITPHTKFLAILYVLKKEGGRHSPFFLGYQPQFYMRTTDVTGKVTRTMNGKDEESKMLILGDWVKIVVELIMPVACEQGMSKHDVLAFMELGNKSRLHKFGEFRICCY